LPPFSGHGGALAEDRVVAPRASSVRAQGGNAGGRHDSNRVVRGGAALPVRRAAGLLYLYLRYVRYLQLLAGLRGGEISNK
jgi:hypothetical protein